MKDLLLPNTVSQKDEKPHTAGLDDTAIPHFKIKITELPLGKNLNTVSPYVPLDLENRAAHPQPRILMSTPLANKLLSPYFPPPPYTGPFPPLGTRSLSQTLYLVRSSLGRNEVCGIRDQKGWIRNQKPGGSKLWDQRSGAKFQGRYYLVDLRPRNGPKSAQYRWKTQKGKQRIKGKRYLLKNNDSNGKTRRSTKLAQRLFVAESVFCFYSQQCAHLLTS